MKFKKSKSQVEGIVVGSGKPRLGLIKLLKKLKNIRQVPKTPRAVFSVIRNNGSKKRLLIVVSTGVIILVGAGATGLLFWNKSQGEKTTKSQCSDGVGSPLLKEASANLNPDKSAQLAPIVSTIQALDGYEKYPNCLNIIVTYYINTTDYNNAKNNMDKLEAVYDSEKGFSKELGGNSKSIETLRGNIKFLEKFADNIRKNAEKNPQLWTPE